MKIVALLFSILLTTPVCFAECFNGSCSRPLSRVDNVARFVVAAPVRVVENIVTNKPVRKVVASPFRAVQKYRGTRGY